MCCQCAASIASQVSQKCSSSHSSEWQHVRLSPQFFLSDCVACKEHFSVKPSCPNGAASNVCGDERERGKMEWKVMERGEKKHKCSEAFMTLKIFQEHTKQYSMFFFSAHVDLRHTRKKIFTVCQLPKHSSVYPLVDRKWKWFIKNTLVKFILYQLILNSPKIKAFCVKYNIWLLLQLQNPF